MTTISKDKFFFSSPYREGVNDAIDWLLEIKKNLLADQATTVNCGKIYDEIVNAFFDDLLVFCEANVDAFWGIIYLIVCWSYKKSVEHISSVKKIQRELNQKLLVKTTRDGLDLRTRYKLLARDCFKCTICGHSPATDPTVTLVIDHDRPLSKGGEDSISNYRTLCQYCNAGKGNIY